MPGIHEVQEKVVEFLVTELGKEREEFRLIKLSRSEEGWEGRVEVTEQNKYLQKLGYPVIFDRNIYSIQLDEGLAVVGFALSASRERSYATEEREEI
ncbi:MAG: hypothetical protein HYT87_10935 [Nitrospirae bacterium]|nr:hypothetical protein [Nitrospirota bacterium]